MLVAIDDMQWLDAASAEALAFAARRLEDSPRRGSCFARRPGEPTALERALERRTLERMRVGPLERRRDRGLLADGSAELPRPLLRRIVDATLGNPLFALEVGRMLVARGLPAPGEDIPVPSAVEELLGTRVAALAGAARRLLLAVALSGDLHLDELAAVEAAARSRTRVDGGAAARRRRARARRRIRCSPPRADSARAERTPRAHAALADVVRDDRAARAAPRARPRTARRAARRAPSTAAARGAAARGAARRRSRSPSRRCG